MKRKEFSFLGDVLKRFMMEIGVTNREVAAKVGLTESYFSKLLHDSDMIPKGEYLNDLIEKLLKVLGEIREECPGSDSDRESTFYERLIGRKIEREEYERYVREELTKAARKDHSPASVLRKKEKRERIIKILDNLKEDSVLMKEVELIWKQSESDPRGIP